MLDLVKPFLLLLLTEDCFDTYFEKFDFLDVPCFKAAVSKGLGLAIVAGSVTVKVPQLLKILNNKSGEGINIVGVLLDLCAMTATVSYSFVKGFPFSSWGDAVFLSVQQAAIAALVIYFSSNAASAGIFGALYSFILFVLTSGLTPISVLWFLQACNIPLVLAGRSIQIYTNYQNSSTGQLSAVTCFMLMFGSTARIFTSIQETGDTVMILTFAVASLTNIIIVSQLLYYWNSAAGKKDIKKD